MPIEDFIYTIPIEPEAILWRYVSFEKFNHLIESSSLFFCRADKFSDPFEGTIPKREYEHRHKQNITKANISGDLKRIEIGSSNEAGIQNLHRAYQMGSTVNCWHINNTESNTMWQAYVKDNEGVAIQSTPDRLKLSLINSAQKIRCSKVRYLDFENDIWFHPKEFPHDGYNLFSPLVHKRKEFQDEREFRLIHVVGEMTDKRDFNYWDSQPNTHGVLINVDLDMLIDKIVVHPTAEESTIERVRLLLEKANINKKVEKSILQSPRYF